MSLTKVSVSKSCFYNDCVSHPEADRTLTDGRFSYQYYFSRFYQPKKYPAKNEKKNKIGRKKGPAKTIFGQKSGPAMAGPAVPPTTALLQQNQIYSIECKERGEKEGRRTKGLC